MKNLTKQHTLFIILGGFFICNALVAEFIGVKIFSLEKSLGFAPLSLQLLGNTFSFNMTAGVLLWPIVFVMTDIINEYYGKKGVRLLSYLAAGMIAYSFVMVFSAIQLNPADFWITKEVDGVKLPMQLAYSQIFGQGLWIIIGSLIAFLFGQLIDVTVFHFLKTKTGERMLWLRSTGSTLVSQFIDSFVVLFIAFYIGAGWDLKLVIGIGIVNYIYKFSVALILTPLLYLVHAAIDAYLGKELAAIMLKEAANQD